MKQFIKGLLFLCLIMMIILSCTKTTSNLPSKYYSDYQFKIISTDIVDDTTSQTPIWDFSLATQNTIVTEQKREIAGDGGSGDDCHGDNARTNPNCQAMPVIFENVNFRREGYNIYVTWIAEVEYNIKNYYIQASIDGGKTWNSIQSVAPHGQGIQYNISFSLWTENISK